MSIYYTLYKKDIEGQPVINYNRGAQIKPIASATTLQMSYSLHSTPIKEDKHGNLSTSEEYW